MKSIWPQIRCRWIYFSLSLPILLSPSRENAKTIAFYHFLRNFPFLQSWLTKKPNQNKNKQTKPPKNPNRKTLASHPFWIYQIYPCYLGFFLNLTPLARHLQDTAKFFKGSKDPLCSPSLISFSLTPLSPGLFSPFNFIFGYHRSRLPSIIPLPFISKFNELSFPSSSFARQRSVYIDYAAK